MDFQWTDSFYKKACLPFGLTTAPVIFNLFADAFEWILRICLLWHTIIYYLDDFIRIIPKQEAASIIEADIDYIHLTDALGIPRNDSKNRCSTVTEVLGIEIDTTRFIARLSKEKLNKALIKTFIALAEGSLTKRDAQKLVGYLSHCCKVVRLGRVFLSSAWEFLSQNFLFSIVRRRINRCFRDDLIWWNITLFKVNGIVLFDDIKRPNIYLFIDACLRGLGGFFYEDGNNDWHANI